MDISDKNNLTKTCYNYLKNKILKCELLPGERLIESEISIELKVSRTPIRTALEILSLEGLVYNIPRHSYVVSKISYKEIKEFYDFIRRVGPWLISKASNSINSDKDMLFIFIDKLKYALSSKDLSQIEPLIYQWTDLIINFFDSDIYTELQTIINRRIIRFYKFIFQDEKNIFLLADRICQISKYMLTNDEINASISTKILIKDLEKIIEDLQN